MAITVRRIAKITDYANATKAKKYCRKDIKKFKTRGNDS